MSLLRATLLTTPFNEWTFQFSITMAVRIRFCANLHAGFGQKAIAVADFSRFKERRPATRNPQPGWFGEDGLHMNHKGCLP